jgi:hypothetical protein
MPAIPTKPASEKQIAFIASLAQQLGQAFDTVNLSSYEASQAIEAFLAARKAKVTAPVDTTPLEAGMYRKDEVIYKVYRTVHGANTICAKRLNEVPVPAGQPRSFEFEYVGLAAKHGILAAHRMSLDEAKAFGAVYGVCCVCSATLTDEGSIAAGIGPICGGKV